MSDEFNAYLRNPLWKMLVETVHAMAMYPHHKAYVKNRLLLQKPEIKPLELAAYLGIPVGEALVILYEIKGESEVSQGSMTEKS